MILVDTSGFLAAHGADQRLHRACADVLRRHRGPFVLSPFVLAEIDYLVGKLAGVEAQIEVLAEVAGGAYLLSEFGAADVEKARRVVVDYGEHRIGLADASIVVLAERYSTRDILTLDQRHFRVLRNAAGKSFRLLPADR